MRDTGIDIIGPAPWGTHFCQFYETAQDLIDILVPYFAAGLAHNEFCLWITSEPLGVEQAKAALQTVVGDLDPYLRSGQLEILDYREWYTADGGFDADRVLRGWVTKLEAALEKGFEGLRLTGNTFWLEKSVWQDFADYEAAVDGVIGQYPMLAICTYSLLKCGAPEVLDVMANHAFALIEREGAWQIIESAERRRTWEALRESEQRWATTLASIGDAVIATDSSGAVTFMNPVAERLTGWSADDAAGKPVTEVFHILNERTRTEVESPVDRVLRDGTVVGLANHTILVRKDGTDLPIDDSGAPIHDERGDVVGVVLVFRDISERKQAEAHAAWLASFPERNPMPVMEVETSGRVYYANPAGRQAVPGLEGHGLQHPWLAGLQEVADALARGAPHLTRDVKVGEAWYQQTIAAERDGRLRIYTSEVTERRRAEDALRRERDFVAAVLDTVGALVVVLDRDGRIRTFNRACESLTKYSAPEVIGRVFWEFLIPPDDLPGVEATWRALRAGDFPNRHENHWLAKDGSQRLLAWSNTALVHSDGQVEYIIGTGVDITERRHAREALQESLERLSRAEAIAHLGSWELDVIDNHLSWSDEVYRIFGLQPQEFKATYGAFLEAVHPDDREAVDAAYIGSLREGKACYEIEHRVLRKSTGEVRWVHERCEHIADDSGRIVRSVGMVLDITERKRAEEALLEAERARTRLAQALASEVGHRTKNNLAIVAGLLQMQMDEQSESISGPDLIRDAATRIMSFAALHDQMYQTRSDVIELVDALRRISEVSRQALSAGDLTIAVEGEPVTYPADVGTNLCVVANELITNAIKHSESASGLREVGVRVLLEDGRLTLLVWNSNSRLEEGFDVVTKGRTGLGLVRTIVEDQYGGSFALVPDRKGTLARVILDDRRLRETR